MSRKTFEYILGSLQILVAVYNCFYLDSLNELIASILLFLLGISLIMTSDNSAQRQHAARVLFTSGGVLAVLLIIKMILIG